MTDQYGRELIELLDTTVDRTTLLKYRNEGVLQGESPPTTIKFTVK